MKINAAAAQQGTKKVTKRVSIGAQILLLLLVLAAATVWATVWWLNQRGEAALPPQEKAFTSTPQQIERGAYLAQVGNCAACHTVRGGAPYAGGRVIETPFGEVFAGNLTPDLQTGLGRWTRSEFWRALHNGRARDGRLLYPAFPYTNTTLITRDDADALYAYLQRLPAVVQARPAHTLRFPYNTQAALAVWRALYFTPEDYQPEASRSAEWNRGAYLVQGVGHCKACHATRNALGAVEGGRGDFGGGMIPMQGWYAPSLHSAAEAGVAEWSVQQVVDLLKTGVSVQATADGSTYASALGPMADVVYRSTQHWTEADLRSTAEFLKSLPSAPSNAPSSPSRVAVSVDLNKGKKIYENQCADCHGGQGEGRGAYPPLAGNRAVTMNATTNLVRILRSGGFPPATAGNPRPYSMPPFELSGDDMAAVVSYIRGAWGNKAAPISAAEVLSGK